jgi:hypothetical protein
VECFGCRRKSIENDTVSDCCGSVVGIDGVAAAGAASRASSGGVPGSVGSRCCQIRHQGILFFLVLPWFFSLLSFVFFLSPFSLPLSSASLLFCSYRKTLLSVFTATLFESHFSLPFFLSSIPYVYIHYTFSTAPPPPANFFLVLAPFGDGIYGKKSAAQQIARGYPFQYYARGGNFSLGEAVLNPCSRNRTIMAEPHYLLFT